MLERDWEVVRLTIGLKLGNRILVVSPDFKGPIPTEPPPGEENDVDGSDRCEDAFMVEVSLDSDQHALLDLIDDLHLLDPLFGRQIRPQLGGIIGRDPEVRNDTLGGWDYAVQLDGDVGKIFKHSSQGKIGLIDGEGCLDDHILYLVSATHRCIC